MARKSVKQSKMVDRISDLPDNIIHFILSLVPLRDAVRTSILSKKWRLHWTRIDSLVLDSHFNEYIDIYHGSDSDSEEDEMQASIYAGIVGSILLSHSGTIRKFFLRVPYYHDIPKFINLWMLSLSRHGVQDLTLDYFDYAHYCKVPSFVFQCVELKHLSLGHVRSIPHNFEGLSSLLSLDLDCDMVSGDLLKHIFLNCPLLERLSLRYSGSNDSFAIDAGELKVLCLSYHQRSNFILKNTPHLSTVSLYLSGRPYMNSHVECSNILDFFGAMPKLEKIKLTGSVLEEWGVQDVPRLLPAPLENHLSLNVDYLNMYSLAQVCSFLWLVKSSPILQTVNIFSIPDPGTPPLLAIDYLKSQLTEDENLWSLQTVKIGGLKGMEPEIVFIEMILACCPMLEKLYLSSRSRKSDAEFKMMTDIMRFPRASTKAEIMYSKENTG